MEFLCRASLLAWVVGTSESQMPRAVVPPVNGEKPLDVQVKGTNAFLCCCLPPARYLDVAYNNSPAFSHVSLVL